MTTKIEWCQETWNPVTGCTQISEGCAHCYAKRMVNRLKGRYGYPEDEPFRVTVHHDKVAGNTVAHWKKPRQIFVCSMGDLFHEDVPFDTPHHVFQTAGQFFKHTYIILTKRPQRMLEFSKWMSGGDDLSAVEWPRNCWLGVTAENQQRADERIPILLEIPAAVRFVSVEPMLGPVDLKLTVQNMAAIVGEDQHLHWVICGGESGPGARPMHPDWARSLRDQCASAGVPFFFKQWGEYGPPITDEQEKGFSDGKGYGGSLSPTGSFENKGNGYMRLGKKNAGRLLDGRTYDQYPTH